MKGSLLVRLWLHGVVLLSLAVAAVFAVGHFVVAPALVPRDPWPSLRAIEAVLSATQPLGDELARLSSEHGLDVSVYDVSGALQASTRTPPLPPLPVEVARRVRGPSPAPPRGHHHEAGPPMLPLLLPPPGPGRMMGGPPRPPHFIVPQLEDAEVLRYAIVEVRPKAPGLGYAAMVIGLWALLLAGLSWFVARSLTRPIERLSQAMRSFGGGDVAARARLDDEGEVGALGASFDAMADDIVQARRAEKELVAGVSHELRTPLARIRVLLELAEDSDPSSMKRYLGEIASDLTELERLLADVLTVARLDLASSGEAQPLRREATRASALIDRAVQRFASMHEGRALDVSAEGLDVEMSCDPVLARRAIDNLLDNAAKYAEPSRGPIELSARSHDGHLEVAVRDRGEGIDEADLARVFDPFFRADKSRARKTGGVGLGLPLVRRIAEAHGGTITLTSVVGEGTTATLRLPLADAPR